MAEAKKGRQTPTQAVTLPYDRTHGAEAVELYNQTGRTAQPWQELLSIGRLAVQYDAYVITDEVYEHMVYAPYHHTCMASLPGMFDNTITCNSLSKTYSITGWRLGYLIGLAEVVENAKKVHDFLTVGAAAPLQEAAAVGLRFDESYYAALREIVSGPDMVHIPYPVSEEMVYSAMETVEKL